MANADGQLDLTDPTSGDGILIPSEPLHLRITFDLGAGEIGFEWTRHGARVVARGRLLAGATSFLWAVLDWRVEFNDRTHNGHCSAHASSARALLNRIRLTATPVQNSLEDLYNLVTLVQPGQMPSPKEFRARFVDPKRPRQPREPEELRHLLGQVIIRNTRANAGLKLPPRRAETQFCHRLANFDLPWNPMEIEQRIGRLHRLGQQHPVRIYNFVQSGTLQKHLLEVLQEKLNLFELVVGETGLVLGECFGSDEFADEVLRRWRDSDGRVAEAFASLGDELAAARDAYAEVKQLDETLFAKDYESL